MAKKCMSCGGSMKKMQKGGTTSNSRLEKLTSKVNKKTTAGKPVSKSLTKRYDKAVDKVIVGGMKKMQTGGKTVPVGTVTSNGRVWNGKGYNNPATTKPAPAPSNTVPVGTVISDGRIWNGKGYDPAPLGSKRKGGMMKAQYGTSTGPNKGAYDTNTGMQRTTSSRPPMAKKGGIMKGTVGGPGKKPFAAGIPYYTGAGQTGPESMSIGGTIKKVNEIRKGALKVRRVARMVDKAQNLKKVKSGKKAMTDIAKTTSPISTLKNMLYKKYKK